jgi:hypothetical protein
MTGLKMGDRSLLKEGSGDLYGHWVVCEIGIMALARPEKLIANPQGESSPSYDPALSTGQPECESDLPLLRNLFA